MSTATLTLQQTVEALAFAADEPIQPDDIAKIYAKITGQKRPKLEEITAASEAINSALGEAGSTLRLRYWAGGYCFSTIASASPCLTEFFQSKQGRKLSRPLMETLAILAYRQPATKPEIDYIRGVDSDYTLRRLQEVGFADIVGRAETVGRPMLYGTTSVFLEEFGLGSLDDLPDLEDVRQLVADSAAGQDNARLILLGERALQAELELELE